MYCIKRNCSLFGLPPFLHLNIYLIAIAKSSNWPIQNLLNFLQLTFLSYCKMVSTFPINLVSYIILILPCAELCERLAFIIHEYVHHNSTTSLWPKLLSQINLLRFPARASNNNKYNCQKIKLENFALLLLIDLVQGYWTRL